MPNTRKLNIAGWMKNKASFIALRIVAFINTPISSARTLLTRKTRRKKKKMPLANRYGTPKNKNEQIFVCHFCGKHAVKQETPKMLQFFSVGQSFSWPPTEMR